MRKYLSAFLGTVALLAVFFMLSPLLGLEAYSVTKNNDDLVLVSEVNNNLSTTISDNALDGSVVFGNKSYIFYNDYFERTTRVVYQRTIFYDFEDASMDTSFVQYIYVDKVEKLDTQGRLVSCKYNFVNEDSFKGFETAKYSGYTPDIEKVKSVSYTAEDVANGLLEDSAIHVKYTTDKIDIIGQNIWDDNNNKFNVRPNRVVIQLYADGEALDGRLAFLDDGESSFRFEGLPTHNGNKEIEYTVKQLYVADNYQVTYIDPIYESEYLRIDLINTYVVPAKAGDATYNLLSGFNSYFNKYSKTVYGEEEDGSEYSYDSLTFKTNYDHEQFDYLSVDGIKLSADNYEISSGSTVIQLDADYLDELNSGKHLITIYIKDGRSVSTTFEIKNTDESKSDVDNVPDTAAIGQYYNYGIVQLLMGMSILTLVNILKRRSAN